MEAQVSDLYLEQRQLEIDAVENGVLRYNQALMECDRSTQPPEMRYISQGMDTLVPAIKELQDKVARGELMSGMSSWGIPIVCVSADKLALLTLTTLFNYEGMCHAAQASYVAEQVLMQIVYEKAKTYCPGLVSRVESKLKGGISNRIRAVLKRNVGKHTSVKWTPHTKQHVGGILIDTALNSTDVLERCRVMTSTGRMANGVRIREDLKERIDRDHSNYALLKPMLEPMIVPPMDWTTLWDGGYLIGDDEFSCVAPLVKTGFKNHLELVTPENMGRHVDAVNHLQRTRWTTNMFIHDVVKEVHESGSQLGVVLNTEPLPEVSKNVDWDDPEAKALYMASSRAVHDHNKKSRGQRKLIQYLKDTGEKFSKYDEYYFQWQTCFRGRFYPRFCGMDPQGDKLSKSYLKFAKAEPLGEVGYRWLTIHLANCMGYDKEALDVRIRKVEERAEEIHRWAESPLDYKGWAVGPDGKPEGDTTMTLAAAKDWSEATRSSCKEEYLSHLSAPVDGKCNGLQHLSALARDSVGARATCLVPDDVPQDIYTLVWEKVDEFVERVIKEANFDQIKFELPEKLTLENVRSLSVVERATRKRQQDAVAAKYWRGKTSRKLVKGGAMTWGYGVTKQGIMNQIINGGFVSEDDGSLTPNALVYSSFIRDAIYWAVNNTVLSARDVMEWLQSVSDIASSKNKPIWWTNPAGMRIHQEYLNPRSTKVLSVAGEHRFLIKGSRNNNLAKKRQKNGIAPNFVHSIDAAHMANVILRLKEEGIVDMHMVHDSFAVHACHTDLLNKIIREEFVKIHERNLLEEFKVEVEEQLGEELPPYPKQGDFDVRDILKSTYAFS